MSLKIEITITIESDEECKVVGKKKKKSILRAKKTGPRMMAI